ncbi:MAG: hypothetical protein HN981_04375 [Candidatus Pacebacteria bacterium]|jgi:hypothetical protein|nr:hypothetical protein [Candidatus Paceibacterota bacterium]MBT4652482.1 hypothetical protein [Candidatus Paceibacterota bacterium]MBT6756309.1 hypothetical protein [Candidatus Paceibacterota bacterium]MBT6921600.1 hypothetical protein [Candidatus Paceibacterota bacterium]
MKKSLKQESLTKLGRIIPYKKELNKITGSIGGSIFLKQLMYWDEKNNGKFYKFLEPCNHKLYQPGDSWTEDLGLSAKVIRKVIKKIGFKRGAGVSNQIKKENSLFDYYTDKDRVTFYILNRTKTKNVISDVCEQAEKELQKKQKAHVLKKNDNLIYIKEFTKYLETFNILFKTNYRKTEGNFKNFIKIIRNGYSLNKLIEALNKMSKDETYINSDFTRPGYILSSDEILNKVLYS